jgi:hypothetical protein
VHRYGSTTISHGCDFVVRWRRTPYVRFSDNLDMICGFFETSCFSKVPVQGFLQLITVFCLSQDSPQHWLRTAVRPDDALICVRWTSP